MDARAKSAVLHASRALGIDRIARRRMRGKLLALCYHGVVADDHPDRFRYENTVSLREFRQQLEFVYRHYRPISAADLIKSRENGLLARNAALITFDDGYRNNLVAAEVLRRMGVPCVFFVTTNYIGTGRVLWTDEVMNRVIAWPGAEIPLPEGGTEALPVDRARRSSIARSIKERCKKTGAGQLRQYLELLRQTPVETVDNRELFDFLDWDGVRTLAGQGFEIGSHTVEHPILTRLTPQELDQELTESRRRIEVETGMPCRSIAYPNGGPEDVSEDVIAAARRAGYTAGFTIAERFSDPGEDLMAISRLCVMGHLPEVVFEYRASGVNEMVRWLR
jgi:peptidoglycan/xylan/chitin deacetylase (PgdA/CDA1 family)